MSLVTRFGMNEIGVIDALCEGNRLQLCDRRALACVSQLHSKTLRNLFAEKRLHVSNCDRSYENVVFISKCMRLPTSKAEKKMNRVLPLLCVEGETKYPEMRLDQMYWHNVVSIDVSKMSDAAVYFLSRILAEEDSNTFHSEKISFNIGKMKRAPEEVYRNIDIGNTHDELPHIYTAMSGVNEHVAMHTMLSRGGCPCTPYSLGGGLTRRTDITELCFNYMVFGESAAKEVGTMICKQSGLQRLHVSDTNCPPLYDPYLCLFLLEKTTHVFTRLVHLDISNNPFVITEPTAIGDALSAGRFPALTNFNISGIGMCDIGVQCLAKGLGCVRNQLEYFHIDRNPLGCLGISTLMSILIHSKSLRLLSITNVDCQPAAYERVALYVKQGYLPNIIHVIITLEEETKRARVAMDLALNSLMHERNWNDFVEQQCDTSTPLGFN